MQIFRNGRVTAVDPRLAAGAVCCCTKRLVCFGTRPRAASA